MIETFLSPRLLSHQWLTISKKLHIWLINHSGLLLLETGQCVRSTFRFMCRRSVAGAIGPSGGSTGDFLSITYRRPWGYRNRHTSTANSVWAEPCTDPETLVTQGRRVTLATREKPHTSAEDGDRLGRKLLQSCHVAPPLWTNLFWCVSCCLHCIVGRFHFQQLRWPLSLKPH